MRSLRHKLLIYVLPLCLIPLIGVSMFSYYQAKQRITEDRIVLYLEQLAVNVADNIRLTLLEKTEEIVSMTLYREFHDFLLNRTTLESSQLLLDQLLVVHDVYDVLALFDVEGNLLLTNSIKRGRFEESLDEEKLQMAGKIALTPNTSDSVWIQEVRSGTYGFIDWHSSDLVRQLYDYYDTDVAYQHSISFAAPIMDERGVVLGGILSIMNWQYIQEILDKVEEDLDQRSLSSGYAFLLGADRNTIIGHKFRRNRDYYRSEPIFPTSNVTVPAFGLGINPVDDLAVVRNNYGLRLDEDLHLGSLRDALLEGATHFRYEYPIGIAKISGLAPINHEYFRWVCGVGMDDEDIFAPVRVLLKDLIWVTTVTVIAVLLLTISVARQITTPLKKLTEGATVIGAGDLSQRVRISSRDEIGELARTFNGMAQSLEERSQALLDLNRKLEDKVEMRTRKLEATSNQVQAAYRELKEAQVQLIQSEKMASLGQLVAGIGHEIKNPLNFIYGNTNFLKTYVGNLKRMIWVLEEETKLDEGGADRVESLKKEINYSFMLEDLDALIQNFEEGAERIHSIIMDLKTFSRMDSDEFQLVNIHEPIDLALNLLQNEYRDSIRIHKEFGDLPVVECHPGKIGQVFLNLLVNACQAICQEGDIWIRTRSKNEMAFVEIEDNGSGITQPNLGKIFEPFFTTKSVGKGTGLGLSISYGIVQQHQGNIRVESAEGKGTKVQVQLPFNSVHGHAARDRS